MFRPLTPRQLAFDVGLAVVCVLLRYSMGVTSLVEVLFIAAMGAALALRRVSPPLALATAWCGALVQMLGAYPPDMSNFSILAVLYATAAYGSTRVKWLGLVSAGVGAGIGGVYLVLVPAGIQPLSPASLPIGDLSTTMFAFVLVTGSMAVLLGLSWTLGLLARTRASARASKEAQARAEQEELTARRLAIVEQERNRIARDMHDVVAHSLAVVIAQADGARYAIRNDPDAAATALATISGTAREALGDVRVLLGQLRHSQAEGPQPTLDDLERLIEQLRSSGLAVRRATEGSAGSLPTGHQIAVYRIIQEALTNVLRHGDSTREVVVTFAWRRSGLNVTVDSALRSEPELAVSTETGESRVLGHGLAGMRERAGLVGGSLVAEPRGDRFIVTAEFPVAVQTTTEPGAARG